jgi:hypothetical protein
VPVASGAGSTRLATLRSKNRETGAPDVTAKKTEQFGGDKPDFFSEKFAAGVKLEGRPIVGLAPGIPSRQQGELGVAQRLGRGLAASQVGVKSPHQNGR